MSPFTHLKYDFKEYLGIYSLQGISGAIFMSFELKKNENHGKAKESQ